VWAQQWDFPWTDILSAQDAVATEGTQACVAPYSNAPVEVEITGGNLVRFSNMKLTFLGIAIDHFGSQPYDGVVVLGR
jgi:hypothetical protein